MCYRSRFIDDVSEGMGVSKRKWIVRSDNVEGASRRCYQLVQLVQLSQVHDYICMFTAH